MGVDYRPDRTARAQRDGGTKKWRHAHLFGNAGMAAQWVPHAAHGGGYLMWRAIPERIT